MNDETIRIDRRDDIIVVTLCSDEFQGEVANGFLSTLTEAIEGVENPKVVLDLSNVVFVDSLSLGTLVKAAGDLTRKGGKFMVAGAQESVRRTLALTRLNKLFNILPTADEAIRELKEATGS